jgi:ribose 5-phosphate isomerase B
MATWSTPTPNHANVLALSLRSTSSPVAREILKEWFETPFSDDEWNLKQISRLQQLEQEGSSRKVEGD